MIKGEPMLLVKFELRRRSPSLSIISSRLYIRQHLRRIHSFKHLMPSTIASRQAIKRRLKIKLLKTLNWVKTLNWLKVPVLKLEAQHIKVRKLPELLNLARRPLQWSYTTLPRRAKGTFQSRSVPSSQWSTLGVMATHTSTSPSTVGSNLQKKD
jgi:hypothetical protein